MAKSVRALFLLGLFGVFGVVSLLAQVSTSSITGVVTDSTGAIVANAKVEAKNDDTGVIFDQNTTNAGTYAFPSLTPGSYSITVRMTGFQTFTSAHNVLTVGTPLVVEATVAVIVTFKPYGIEGVLSVVAITTGALVTVSVPFCTTCT